MTDEEMMSSVATLDDVATENAQTDADRYQLPLTKDTFVKFSQALGLIQNICNDCDIHGGVIRCRTNDRKNAVIMDLTSIVGARNIAFSGLKNKLLLLGTFSLVSDNSADSSVLVESNESNFEFSDAISRLIIRRPISTYLDNVFIDDDDFAAIDNAANREDCLLFNTTINSMEKKRIAKLCDIFGSNTVTFEFNGDTCQYSTQTTSKDNVSRTTQTITLLKQLEGKKTLLNNLSFVLDTPSDLTISCYVVGNDYCMFKSTLNYFGIPITLYTKTRIVDMNADN